MSSQAGNGPVHRHHVDLTPSLIYPEVSNLSPQIGQCLRAGPHAGLVSLTGCSNNPSKSSRSVFPDELRLWRLQ